MPAHLAAGQHMVLAAVDQLQRNTQRLHHRRTSAAQVVRRLRAIFAAGRARASSLRWSFNGSRYATPITIRTFVYCTTRLSSIYCMYVQYYLVGAMKIRVVKMRSAGVAVERRMLNDRYTVKHCGMLVIMDVSDQGLRRPVKVARLTQPGRPGPYMELLDPHIVWANDGKFTLAGFERTTNAEGQVIEFAQSWLCALDLALPEPAIDTVGGRSMRS